MSEQGKKSSLQDEIILTVVSTAIFIAMYYLLYLMQDPMKRQVLLQEIKRRIHPAVELDRFRNEILKFRAEMSKWEHEQRRGNASQGK